MVATDFEWHAIETAYDGHRFRSRLEARWAVFFNALGIPYEYEKEGFDLGGLRYLPDFWLPRQHFWIEVKGVEATDSEMRKAMLLAAATERTVFVFSGQIRMPDDPEGPMEAEAALYLADGDERCGVKGVWCPRFGFPDIKARDHWLWCQCPYCGRVSVGDQGDASAFNQCRCFEQRLPNLSCSYRREHERLREVGEPADTEFLRRDPATLEWWWRRLEAFCSTYDTPNLVDAYGAARQARFEFGEAGR